MIEFVKEGYVCEGIGFSIGDRVIVQFKGEGTLVGFDESGCRTNCVVDLDDDSLNIDREVSSLTGICDKIVILEKLFNSKKHWCPSSRLTLVEPEFLEEEKEIKSLIELLANDRRFSGDTLLGSCDSCPVQYECTNQEELKIPEEAVSTCRGIMLYKLETLKESIETPDPMKEIAETMDEIIEAISSDLTKPTTIEEFNKQNKRRRKAELKSAIESHLEADVPISTDWIREYNNLLTNKED